MKHNYTVDEVKEKLPNVRVNVSGKITVGRVMGRKNRYATVHTSKGSFEYSWIAVTRAVNGDYALKA